MSLDSLIAKKGGILQLQPNGSIQVIVEVYIELIFVKESNRH